MLKYVVILLLALAVNAAEPIKTPRGRVVGKVDGNRAYNEQGRLLGKFSNGTTYQSNGRQYGKGNLLSALIIEDAQRRGVWKK